MRNMCGQDRSVSFYVLQLPFIQAGFCRLGHQDERLSTVAAEDALLEGNLSRSERKTKVDKVAAAVFLQEWLDSQQ